MPKTLKTFVGLLLYLWLAAGTSPAQAQTDDDLLNRVDSLMGINQSGEALVKAQELLALLVDRGEDETLFWRRVFSRIGTSHYLTGRYDSCAIYYERSAASALRVAGNESHEYAISLLLLGNIYSEMAQYKRSRFSYQQSLAIREKLYGPVHDLVAVTLDRFALLYRRMGDLESSEPLLLRAIDIYESLPDPKRDRFASALHNLANLYRTQSRYSEALEVLSRTLSLQIQALGPTNHEVASTLNDLANTYLSLGQLRMADSLQRRALKITVAAFGPKHSWVAHCTGDLARIYMAQERWDDAYTAQSNALRLFSESLGEGHPEVAGALSMLAELDRKQSRLKRAVGLAWRAYEIRRRHFEINAGGLLEREALVFAHRLRASVDGYFSALIDAGLLEDDRSDAVAGVILNSKGQVSDGVFESHMALTTERDPEISDLALRLREARFKMARQHLQGAQGSVSAARQREWANEVTRLEEQLIVRSERFRLLQAQKDVSVAALAARLPEGSGFVEYLRFSYRAALSDRAEPMFVSLVVSPAGKSTVYNLGAAGPVDEAVDAYRAHLIKLSEKAGLPTARDDREFRSIAHELYRKIWMPIQEHLGRPKSVYVAPDGGLALVSWSTLVDDQNRFLIETVPIRYLSAGRDLLRTIPETTKGTGLLAMGAPDYESPLGPDNVETIDRSKSHRETTNRVDGWFSPTCETFSDLRVPPLPHSRFEVEAIVRSWESQSDETALLFIASDATEDHFKKESAGRRVIHLATHGYYLTSACPGLESEESGLADHPLLLSGLFLAGANRRSEYGADAADNDGVLTAYEISALDLSGTDLVVLSACETGLGSVQEGEGVYGLRRAFQLAGARTVVSSLWPVSDRETARFMSWLYQSSDHDIPRVMRSLQLKQIAELRDNRYSDHPVNWGAFIASGSSK